MIDETVIQSSIYHKLSVSPKLAKIKLTQGDYIFRCVSNTETPTVLNTVSLCNMLSCILVTVWKHYVRVTNANHSTLIFNPNFTLSVCQIQRLSLYARV